jgi:predicted ABC-type ATPase
LGGGNDVPEAIARRRYNRSIRNFLNIYRSLSESWILFDNSGETPKVIASRVGDKARIMVEDEYRNISQQYDGK